jgi:hypothetical protein
MGPSSSRPCSSIALDLEPLWVVAPAGHDPRSWQYAFLKRKSAGAWRRMVPVHMLRLQLPEYVGDSGGMRAYFKRADWDVAEDGLIYNNPTWHAGFVARLAGKVARNRGLSKAQRSVVSKARLLRDVYYSEQGMQGPDYVDLGVAHDACIVLYEALSGRKMPPLPLTAP